MNFFKILELSLYPITTLIVGGMSYMLGRSANLMSISRERLEKVYHPLFLSIEPFLYKQITFEEITPFIDCYNTLEKDFLLFIHPSLQQYMRCICSRKKLLPADKYSSGEWYAICNHISREYDRLCKRAYIPIRSVAYRLNYKQYSSKISMYLGLLWLHLPAILFFGAILKILLTRIY